LFERLSTKNPFDKHESTRHLLLALQSLPQNTIRIFFPDFEDIDNAVFTLFMNPSGKLFAHKDAAIVTIIDTYKSAFTFVQPTLSLQTNIIAPMQRGQSLSATS
jgi:hypothetical protein